MGNISPGVYTKIIDLSTYVQEVPSSIGFLCALTKKGRDNELIFLGGRSELISEFGQPDIERFGKYYGQGMHCAYNFLGESGALYFMRCLPDDASYANIYINANIDSTTGDVSLSLSNLSSINSKSELQTNLAINGTTYPICALYPIGRGEYYNIIGVRLVEHANPMVHDVYILDIYEKQSDGNEVIVESFEVSFNPNKTNESGESIFITDVLETYSKILRAEMSLSDGSWAPGYNYVSREYDKNIGTVNVDLVTASISDNKQIWTDWASDLSSEATYFITAMDARGNKISGWLGPVDSNDSSKIAVYNSKDLATATQSWNGDTSVFDVNGEIDYWIKMSGVNIATLFVSDPEPLRFGSDGSLFQSNGDLDTSVATELLSQAYSGLIDDRVFDTEEIYYNLVFDCGYPVDVKNAIVSMVNTRKDCMAILDNGDNTTANLALSARENSHTFNTYLAALYENYSKVYDNFSGRDIWLSPIYHMSYLLPRNDKVAEVWYAAAGLSRGVAEGVKNLRYNPKLGQRDQFYLKQLNPIIKLAQGYVVWGQLTTQTKPSALQDVNIVRLVLYVKRAIEQFCKYFIFELNDQLTWDSCRSQIVQFLENIASRRGLYDYTVDVGASEYEKKHKTFHVNVTLNPTRVTEKIELNFFVK